MARAIKVEGLKELQRDLRRAQNKDTAKAIREAGKAAAKIVADDASSKAPRVSGRLAGSIKPQAQSTSARVKAGSASRVPYAGPIHFGWGRRNIEPNPFLYDALGDKWAEVYEAYEENLESISKSLSRGKFG